MAQLYRNDYKWREDVKRLANANPLTRALKPLVRGVYRHIDALLPQPRDFLLRMVPRGAVCAEVGVYEGLFTRRIFDKVRPTLVYAIDPWSEIVGSKTKYNQEHQDARYRDVCTRLQNEIGAGTARVMRETSDAAALQIPDQSLDFVYIDGDHSYAQVVKDLANYWLKVKSGGILSGDDYCIPDVKRAVDEFAQIHNLTVTEKNIQFILTKKIITRAHRE